MRITIDATADDMPDYLNEVLRQFNEGFSSGYVDHYTHWVLDRDE